MIRRAWPSSAAAGIASLVATVATTIGCGGAVPPAPQPRSPVGPSEPRIAPGASATASAAPSRVDATTSPRADACTSASDCATACTSGSAAACTSAGKLRLGRDPADAAPLFERACPSDGEPTNRDLLHDRLPDPEGCHLFAVLLGDGRGVAADPERSRTILDRLCTAGRAESCATLATEYRAGKKLPRDEAKALALAVRACDLGSQSGCHAAGVAFDLGQGTTPDEAQARQYFSRGCGRASGTGLPALHDTLSCGALEELDQRVRPFERTVVRTFHVSHRESRAKAERSPAEARQLVDQAVKELAAGKSFDAVADKFGGADPVERIGRAERVVFRHQPKPGDPLAPVYDAKVGRAVVTTNPSFGFVVWYRVR